MSQCFFYSFLLNKLHHCFQLKFVCWEQWFQWKHFSRNFLIETQFGSFHISVPISSNSFQYSLNIGWVNRGFTEINGKIGMNRVKWILQISLSTKSFPPTNIYLFKRVSPLFQYPPPKQSEVCTLSPSIFHHIHLSTWLSLRILFHMFRIIINHQYNMNHIDVHISIVIITIIVYFWVILWTIIIITK